MGFFSPWFLAGLAAVGLPLWLHLLKQFKRTPQRFSSLMFFERRVQSSTRHRRLRYLALLSARIALLALLALAFSNPFVTRTANKVKQSTLTLIAIDRSFSMQYGHRFQDAKAEAHTLVNAIGGQGKAQIAALDSHVQLLTQATSDKAILNAAVDAMKPGPEVSSYGEFSRALRVMEQTTHTHMDAHLITDVQQTSMPSTFTDLQLGPNSSLAIHAVGKADSPNSAVQAVNVPSHIYGSTSHVRIAATIANWQGQITARNVTVSLDGRKLGSKNVTVPACGRVQVQFDDIEIPYGAHRGSVSIEPGDDLPNDDSFHFAIERSDAPKILFLSGSGHPTATLYYKAAIEASYAEGGSRVQVSSPGETLAEDPGKYAFVVLDDPGKLSTNVEQQLSTYVSKGGSVLITVGRNTEASGTIPVAAETVGSTTITQSAGKVDDKSPALTGIGQLQNVSFLDTARITAGQDDRVLAQFADGSPLLIEKSLGEGRILIFASTLDNSLSDFPLHASFLPFVAQTADYLAGSQDIPSSMVVGSPISLRRTGAESAPAEVIGPDGKRQLSLREATRIISFNLDNEGFYEIQRASGHRVLAAVNADRRESDLARVPAETLALWRNTGTSAAAAVAGTDRETLPWSLWRFAVLLVLVAGLVESIFASRYLREERQTS